MISDREGGGIALVTSPIAPSIRTPVGWPPPSRKLWPSPGGVESRVRPARRIASELAQPAWPSTRRSQTGRLGATASRTAAVGKAPPGQRL